jgi:hypothetical protein
MGTQLVAVRSALVAALAELPEYLAAGPTGQTPELSFGWKSGWTRRERVWTQRARFEHEPASLRATKTFRNEVGYFDLMIFVHGQGLSQEVTSTRAAELMTAAEDFVATHANWHNNALGVGITEVQVVGDGELKEALDEQGGGLAECRVPIRYKARLT